jgi:chromosome segregation ATPase
MPKIRDIFTDGPEYYRRRIRIAILNSRLRDARRGLARIKRELGDRAWQIQAQGCESAPAAAELSDLDRLEKEKAGMASSEIEEISGRLSEAEAEAAAEKQKLHDIDSRLKSAERQHKSRSNAISKIESRLKELRRLRGRLDDDLSFCLKRLSQAESSGPGDSAGKESAADLSDSEESLRARLEETRSEIRSMQARLNNNRRALPGLQESLKSLRAEREAGRVRCGTLEARLDELKSLLGDAEDRSRQASKPLQKKRLELTERLGEELLTRRSDEPELRQLFSSADLAISTIEGLENETSSEETLLELIDSDATAAFTVIVSGACLLALMLISMIITLLVVLR